MHGGFVTHCSFRRPVDGQRMRLAHRLAPKGVFTWCERYTPRSSYGFAMKIIFLFIGALFATVASAQTTYQQIGNITYGSDGRTYQQIGNITYGSDGTTQQQIGNTTYGSDGRTHQQIGNTTYGSDGRSYQQIGNTTYGSDGRSCQRIGNQVH